MRVLITEIIWPIGLDKLKEFAEVEYEPELWKDCNVLLEKVKSVNAIIVRNQTRVNEELLKAGVDLRVVGRLGVGLDNIDIQAAKKMGIDVVFARNANAISVAEYVIASILEASRTLLTAHQDVRQGHWDRKRFTGSELYGKTLGLIGMGEIAHRTAKRASAFGMHIIGYDPFVTPYDYSVAETGIVLTSFSSLLQEADFISIHVPLNAQTASMMSMPEFKEMKSTAIIINTSRGGIINENALFEAIQQNQIAGAFLDVLEQEPIQSAHPLLQCERVVITPHIAGLTEESQVRTSLLVAKEVENVLRGKVALCKI